MPSHQLRNPFNGRIFEKYRKRENYWGVEATQPEYGYA
jgi:hypothetical protein